jgi:hypothetical protein
MLEESIAESAEARVLERFWFGSAHWESGASSLSKGLEEAEIARPVQASATHAFVRRGTARRDAAQAGAA